MLALRSLVFNVLFYALMIFLMVVGLPTVLFGRAAVFRLARLWARCSLWLLRAICGLRVEFRGVENLPKGGALFAAKHQSMLETFALTLHGSDFSFILKRELTLIPVFGWYLKAAEQIAIDRKSGRSALDQAVERSKAALAVGRQIFIFPEGTRRAPGAPPLYKTGVSYIYAAADAPCVPIALNTGLFWGRRSFVRRPGVAVIAFLEPLPPGLPRAEFHDALRTRIEAVSDQLIAESVERDPSLAAVLSGRSAPAA